MTEGCVYKWEAWTNAEGNLGIYPCVDEWLMAILTVRRRVCETHRSSLYIFVLQVVRIYFPFLQSHEPHTEYCSSASARVEKLSCWTRVYLCLSS
jgi:hypothetical protein